MKIVTVQSNTVQLRYRRINYIKVKNSLKAISIVLTVMIIKMIS